VATRYLQRPQRTPRPLESAAKELVPVDETLTLCCGTFTAQAGRLKKVEALLASSRPGSIEMERIAVIRDRLKNWMATHRSICTRNREMSRNNT